MIEKKIQMSSRENYSSASNKNTPTKKAQVNSRDITESDSSLQIARNLMNGDFSSISVAYCHETILTFLRLQNLAVSLSGSTQLIDFYKDLERGVSTVISGSSVNLWIPFPNLQLVVRPTSGQNKPLPEKYKGGIDGNKCTVVLKESGECLGLLEVSIDSDQFPNSVHILLQGFAKLAAVTLRRLNETAPNIQSVFLKALNVMTARNSDQLKLQVNSIKSLLQCEVLQPFLVNDNAMIPLFDDQIESSTNDNNNSYESYNKKITGGLPYIAGNLILWPLMNSKKRVSFVLLAKDKNNDQLFNYQDQLLMSLFAPVIQFTIQNLTSLERKRKQIVIVNNLTRLSETIEQISAANNGPKCIGDLVNIACDILDCEYGTLYLIDHEKMNCCVTVGFSERIMANKDEPPFNECIFAKNPFLITNPIKFGSITAKTSVLSPMIGRNGEIRGILHLMNKNNGFQSSDLRICRLFSSLCGCALSISNSEILKMFNDLISNEYKSQKFTNIAEKLSGIKEIEFTQTPTEYPIKLYNSPVEYIKFENSNVMSPFQKKFCRYLTNVATIMAENRLLKQFTLVDSVIADFMTPKEENKIGVPSKLKANAAERARFNDLNLYTVDLNELQQFKLLFYIAAKTRLFKSFNITARSLFSFLLTTKSKYEDNPYHNWFHAIDVLHFNFIIANASGLNAKLTPIEQLSLYLSLVSHDTGHVGLSNGFLRQTQQPLSMLYDKSILETFHLSNMVQIMSMPGHNFIEGQSKEDVQKFWEISVHIILMTDMERHKEFMTLWDQSFANGVDWNNDNDRTTILSMFTKISDISNCARPFEIAKNWAKRILEENFNQGDKEIQLGLGYSAPLTNRYEQTLPKSQIGFYSFICLPMFQKLADLFPKLQFLVYNIQDNLAVWKEMDEKKINE